MYVSERKVTRGTWVAQLVVHPTLGFGSMSELTVVTWSPTSGSICSEESAFNSHYPPSLCTYKCSLK